MRPKGSSQVLEDRRLRATKLLKLLGISLSEVARRIGCAPSSVMRWRDRLKEGGRKALKVRTSPGRPTRLTPQERARLVDLLLKGSAVFGYPTDLWTTPRIADVIRRTFGVIYTRITLGISCIRSAGAHRSRNAWPRNGTKLASGGGSRMSGLG